MRLPWTLKLKNGISKVIVYIDNCLLNLMQKGFVWVTDGKVSSVAIFRRFINLHEVHHLIKPNLPPLILRHNPCIIFSYSSFLFFIDDSNIMRSALPVVVYIR